MILIKEQVKEMTIKKSQKISIIVCVSVVSGPKAGYKSITGNEAKN